MWEYIDEFGGAFFNTTIKPITASGPRNCRWWVPPTMSTTLWVCTTCDGEFRNFRYAAQPVGGITSVSYDKTEGLGSVRADHYPPADVRRQAGGDLGLRYTEEKGYQIPLRGCRVGPAAGPFRRPCHQRTIPASRCPPQARYDVRTMPSSATPVAMRPWPTTSVMRPMFTCATQPVIAAGASTAGVWRNAV